jgi:hypothetical protein
MKKLFLTLFLGTLVVGSTFASASADIFTIDEARIEADFAELNTLDAYLDEHEGLSLEDLQNSGAAMSLNLSPETMNGLAAMSEAPLGIPSFLWGCVLGWVGILIVYLVSEDKDETKKALYGCLAWTAVGILWYVLWITVFVTAASSAAAGM